MMLIENSFEVAADADKVFDFLQDAHNVAACFPGAELTEDMGDDSYRGKVKIKVGPVTAAYQGIAKIVERDATTRIAVLVAEGKDTKGAGTAKAKATMRVTPSGAGANVVLETDLTISGKLAQFGRGIMADVSGRMVGELAGRVRELIEQEGAAPAAPQAGEPAGAAVQTAPVTPMPRTEAPPMKASTILRSVLSGFFKRLAARLRAARSH
jgi:carbon monoxide dehydrogenase subunit G